MSEEIPYGDTSKKGDTFPLTWAADNNIYTSAGDPLWGKKPDGLDFERISGDAAAYTVAKINEMDGYYGWGGCGYGWGGAVTGSTADDAPLLSVTW